MSHWALFWTKSVGFAIWSDLEFLYAYQTQIQTKTNANSNGILWFAIKFYSIMLLSELMINRHIFLTGHQEFYQLKRSLVTCNSCGHWHERHTLCPNCYSTVRDETERLRALSGTLPTEFYQHTSEVYIIYFHLLTFVFFPLKFSWNRISRCSLCTNMTLCY